MKSSWVGNLFPDNHLDAKKTGNILFTQFLCLSNECGYICSWFSSSAFVFYFCFPVLSTDDLSAYLFCHLVCSSVYGFSLSCYSHCCVLGVSFLLCVFLFKHVVSSDSLKVPQPLSLSFGSCYQIVTIHKSNHNGLSSA